MVPHVETPNRCVGIVADSSLPAHVGWPARGPVDLRPDVMTPWYALPPSSWLEPRTFTCDEQFWARRRIAVLSSRIGRRLELASAWFGRLGQVVRMASRARWSVLTHSRVTCDRWLQPLVPQIDLKLLSVCADDERRTVSRRRSGAPGQPQKSTIAVRVSAPVQFATHDLTERQSNAPDGSIARGPLGDRLLLSLADEIYVLSVRPAGQIHHLLDIAFSHPTFWHQRVFLARGPQAVPDPLLQQWVRAGGIEWTSSGAPASFSDWRERPLAGDSAMRPWAEELPSAVPYLCHWTRAPQGPWPDESEFAYVSDLLWGGEISRTAIDALIRIVSLRRIVASSHLIRGGTKVVGLTAIPLQQFADHRCFRPHQQRWDFEPCGVAISLPWLGQRGVRPVIYGDEATWSRLSAGDRPFFQQSASRRQSPSTVAWTREQEWRHLGDLDLSPLPPGDGFVFVPSVEAARRVAAVSPWPVVLLRSDG